MPDPPPALTPAVFALLLALYEGERHGYALMAALDELTGGTIRLGPGTVYRSLQRMRIDNLVEEVDSVPEGDGRAQRRRSYRITPAGRAALAAEATRLAQLVRVARALGVPTDP
jgi:DNA-binding PadR family transcriptional regulator